LLGIDRNPGYRQGFEVAARRSFRDLQLRGELGGSDPAASLQDQQGCHEAVSTHGSEDSRKSGQKVTGFMCQDPP
jgi:hypothetical protein